MQKKPLQSDLVMLRQQIEEEIAAMRQGFEGYAETAWHQLINHRLANLGGLLENVSDQREKESILGIIVEELEKNL